MIVLAKLFAEIVVYVAVSNRDKQLIQTVKLFLLLALSFPDNTHEITQSPNKQLKQ